MTAAWRAFVAGTAAQGLCLAPLVWRLAGGAPSADVWRLAAAVGLAGTALQAGAAVAAVAWRLWRAR